VLTRRGRPTQVLAYGKTDAAALRARASDFADPKVMVALSVDTLASKLMPTFIEGRRLGFSARLRPTVRTDREGNRARNRELDVFVAAKMAIETLRIDGLESSEVVRRGRDQAKGSRPLARIPGHAVTVAGTLRIADPDGFAALLARGLGRHRAFGYGMLLVSPPEA
jgi:CRISPR system Cascade subunit CasE